MARLRAAVLGFESLDERVVPSVTAKVVDGSLLVGGSATKSGEVVRVAVVGAGAAKVFDGATLVGEYKFSKDVSVETTAAADKVAVDLGGFGIGGNLFVRLGDGKNGVEIGNGKVGKNVVVVGGKADDGVSFGKLTAGLVDVNVAGGFDKVAFGKGFVANEVKVAGSDDTALLAEANVITTLGVVVGPEGGKVAVGGSAGKVFVGIPVGVGARVEVAGKVAGEVVVAANGDGKTAPPAIAKGTELVVLGGVGGIQFNGGPAADAVLIGKSATVAKAAVLNLAGGADVVRIDGTIGSPSPAGTTAPLSLVIEAGEGNDQVFVGPTAKLIGTSKVFLGAGDDTLSVATAAKIGDLFADGGAGKDLFVGLSPRPGLTTVNFEVFAKS